MSSTGATRSQRAQPTDAGYTFGLVTFERDDTSATTIDERL
jgi:hypothetical protein